ncbi:hypothetical protein GCM10012286_46010 [Streptomyces lasiicapitis]|uniref:Uncharacterized protein n=1 Tax=Streptomyces lasiicapitis TaxID=1923961 RepID=A0ABQ2MDQ4_9ACTN|nr:hypothetical protein GCM10012286_46010 [Streptomyces lasiicapitis]
MKRRPTVPLRSLRMALSPPLGSGRSRRARRFDLVRRIRPDSGCPAAPNSGMTGAVRAALCPRP